MQLITDTYFGTQAGWKSIRRYVTESWESFRHGSEKKYAAFLKNAKSTLDTKLKHKSCPRNERLEHYVVKSFLSHGSFGNIFGAVHEATGKNYALKVMKKESLAMDCMVEAVIFEKELGHAVESEFVLRVEVAFQDEFNIYTVMEFAEYGALTRVISQRKKQTKGLSQKKAKFFAAQIVLGLEYLHTCRIAHRDLKPENIFIFRDWYLKIGGFGQAVRLEGPEKAEKTAKRCLGYFGSRCYQSAELENRDGQGADWWALASIIYELIYLRHPYTGDSTTRLSERSKHAEFTFTDTAEYKKVNNFIQWLTAYTTHYKRDETTEKFSQKVKDHAWFKNFSFLDVFEKKRRIRRRLVNIHKLKLLSGEDSYKFIEAKRGRFDASRFRKF